ncbi:MAG: glycosyltransferase family 1 protein [Bacillota bacterium]
MKKKIHILHVVGGMNKAGTETWLMHVLRNIDKNNFNIDFLVHSNKIYDFSEEILSYNSKIIPCVNPSIPWKYTRNFLKIIKQYGPFDIIHCHVHHYSGFILWLAKLANIPVRIAHSHSDTLNLQNKSNIFRRIYYFFMKKLIIHNATAGLAVSRKAGIALFGKGWESNKKYKILSCGIDFQNFNKKIIKPYRRTFKIPDNAFVIGHVGRFVKSKNHIFLIKILKMLIKSDPYTYLLFVGDGPLKKNIEKIAANEGLKNNVIFTGVRDDIADIMLGVMDVFVFPSFYEGLGIVIIEAQAAGLPIVMSDTIPEEVDVVEQLIKRVPLKQSILSWVDVILEMKNTKNKIPHQQILEVLNNSQYNISLNIKDLENFYTDLLR